MKKSIIKIIIMTLMIGLNWAGLSAVVETIAYYNDIENSDANTYQAGTLDFYLYSTTTNFVPPEIVTSMMPGDSVTREISVIKELDSNQFQYNASTAKTGGDDDFCQALKLEARLNGSSTPYYSDGLMNFNLTPPVVLGDNGQDDWLFTVTLPTGTSFPPGKTCQINFVFDGWQINLPDSSGGFSDQEEIASSFATGGMKINKVYYDVDSQHGVEGDNEWIEIYNPLDNPVDISGWLIVDNNATDTIPVSPSVPAKGFAVITGNASTWGYWNIPDGVVKIVLTDGEIGNGLANEGDRVILKMSDGTEDDAMSYGTDTYAFDPSCPDVAEGHILARVPTGLDTNTASDWKDLGLPSVVVIYPTGGGWYCNQNVNLKWTATNPNGPGSDLKITLLYIRDLDKNGVVSAGDGITTIAQDIANTGSYNWKVSPCYYGYVWIKVIATGPENFIVSNSGLSGRVFEPDPPAGMSLEELPEDCCSIEMFAEIIAEYEASLSSENVCAAPSAAQDAEIVEAPTVEEPAVVVEEAEEPTPGVGEDEEITEEEPAVIEETPAEEPVIEEIPPAIEENPPVIEQAPNPEKLPPPPPLEPSDEGLTGQAEPEQELEPNI